MSAEDCEVFSNRWIDDYLLREDFTDPFVKAKCPSVTAKVEVSDLPETTPVRLAFTCPGSRFTN